MNKSMKPTFKKLTKRFDWVNPDIEKNFPIEKVAKNTEYKLFHFKRYISSEDVVKEIEREGYKSATFSELLHWKDWNETDYVVALSSICEVVGYRRVPYLSRFGSKHFLSLDWWGRGWNAYCRFLGVRQMSSESRPFEIPALGNSETLINHLGIK